MSLTVSDPLTYTVSSGQALLFSTVENSETVYKYKLSSGTVGTISFGIVEALGVRSADIPCLVYASDLLNCINENFGSSDLEATLLQKAIAKYSKRLSDQKISKAIFLSTLAELPSNASLNTTIASFVGAYTVTDIDALNALDSGTYDLVWVLDPSGDTGLANSTVPALYRWVPASGNNSAGYVFVMSASAGMTAALQRNSHSHSNLSALNAISMRNGVLYVNALANGTGGDRIKSFDSGSTFTDDTNAIVLDFSLTTRWKLSKLENGEPSYTLVPKNFVDGAEAYIVVYAGVAVSWTGFSLNGNSDNSTGSNHFDGLVWVGGSAPRSISSKSEGFQLIKVMVVDNTVIGQLLVDTCEGSSGDQQYDIEPYVIRAESAASSASGDESDVCEMRDAAELIFANVDSEYVVPAHVHQQNNQSE